ncbi:hypothetical protein ACWPKO_09430 [Coraliomargarita sp. W4R53]
MKTKIASLSIIATVLFSLTASAFSDDFNRNNSTPAGAPWSIGDTANIAIVNNKLAWNNKPAPAVVGVDLASEGLTNTFTASVDFRLTLPDWAGIWVMGDETTSSGGYVFRIKSTTGFMQAVNYSSGTSVNAGGWSNASGTFGALAMHTDYRMTVTASEDPSGYHGIFLFSLDDVSGDEPVNVGSITAKRASAFKNSSTGDAFGIYGIGSNPHYDNFSAIP